MRPQGLRRKLHTLNRHHTALPARNTHNHHRKIIPRAYPLVRIMVRLRIPLTRPGLLQHTHNRTGKISRIARRTNLVEHHTQLVTLPRQPQHRLHEIIPKRRIQPRRPHNQVRRPRSTDSLLPLPLRPAIHPQRRNCIILPVRPARRTVKHIIRRHMHQQRTPQGSTSPKHSRPVPVHPERRLSIIFSPVHSRIRSTIDHHIDIMPLTHSRNPISIGNIQVRQIIKKEPPPITTISKHLKLRPQLPIRSRNKNIHEKMLIRYTPPAQ